MESSNETADSFYVRVCGLPWLATKVDIINLFKECQVKDGPSGIHIMTSMEECHSGEAYVEFETEQDVEKAIEKNEQLRSIYIEVFRSSKMEFENAFHHFEDDSVSPRGIPFESSEEETAHFFPGPNFGLVSTIDKVKTNISQLMTESNLLEDCCSKWNSYTTFEFIKKYSNMIEVLKSNEKHAKEIIEEQTVKICQLEDNQRRNEEEKNKLQLEIVHLKDKIKVITQELENSKDVITLAEKDAKNKEEKITSFTTEILMLKTENSLLIEKHHDLEEIKNLSLKYSRKIVDITSHDKAQPKAPGNKASTSRKTSIKRQQMGGRTPVNTRYNKKRAFSKT